MQGLVHSFQSLGTVDGPGIRYVVFLQGCPLRCGCCHNPDTWAIDGGKVYSAEQIVTSACRYKEYFGKDGGITVSGGEPLLQAEFVKQIFSLSHENNLNTCLDTSGCIINDSVISLLDFTDRVLLDVKYTNDELYKKHVGCSFNSVIKFLDLLEDKKIPTTIRQVIIPTLNDSNQNIIELKEIIKGRKCVDKVELLPFKKICTVKYEQMGIEFKFKDFDTPTSQTMQRLNKLLNN